MPKPRKITQTQLAREMDVSQALVSLVLNGRKEGINQETYEKIWEHAIKRGYHPRGMHLGSVPASANNRQVGFILRAPMRLNSLSAYFSHVQHGLHSALQPQGFTTTFLGSEDLLPPEQLRRLLPAGHNYQGIVILGEVSVGFLNELRAVDRRIVAVSARYPGLCHSVLGNEVLALEQIVTHLHELGHRRIGWVGGNVNLGRHEARLNACRQALASIGLSLAPRYTVTLHEADRAEGGEAMHQLLGQAGRADFPTAFVCYNCLMAEGAARALMRAGIRVPADISVIGADAPREPSSSDGLRVSGAGTDPVRLGQTAARLILTSTGSEDESFTDVILPSQLFQGDTTGPALKK